LVAAMCWSNGFAWKYDTFKKSSFSSWSQPRKPFRSIAHFQTNPYPNMHRESIYFPAVPMYRRFVADRIAPTLGTAHDGDIVRRVVRIAQTAKEKWRAIGHWPRDEDGSNFGSFLGLIVFVTWNVCRTCFFC
jgi:hypothetical protein